MTGPELVRLYGLQVWSELPLHQGRLGDEHAADVDIDVRIRRGRSIPVTSEPPAGDRLVHYELDGRAYYTFVRRTDGSYVLRFVGVCDFRVDPELRTVMVHLVDGADPDLAGVLVTGTVLSFILIPRGEPVLHASAVQVGEQALAFVGYSGMGKSTMATLLCAAGARLVTDDVLRLHLGPPAPPVLPTCFLGPTEMRLRKAAGDLAGLFTRPPDRRTTADSRDALRAASATTDHLPLAAIVVPRPRRDLTDSTELTVTRLAAKEAMLTLLRFPRIVGWEAGAVVGSEFEHAAAVAETVPMFTADVPWGPPFDLTVAESLLDRVGLAAAPEGPQGQVADGRR